MTTINMAFRRPRADGDHVPVHGYVNWVPTARRDMEGYILVARPFRVDLVDGDATVEVLPTTSQWYWKVEEYFSKKVTATKYFIVPDSLTPIDYDDLVEVNEPSIDSEAPASWTAALAEEAETARNADNLTSGTVADARLPSRLSDSSLSATYGSFVNLAKNPEAIITGAVTRNSNGVVTSAAVVWPNGQPGTFTTDTIGSLNTIDGYHITYGSPVTRTYTQPTITRDSSGAATNVPAIVVS